MSKLAGAAKLAAGAFAGIKLTALISDITMANSRFEQLGMVMGVVGRNASLSQDQVNAYAKEVEAMGISMTESADRYQDDLCADGSIQSQRTCPSSSGRRCNCQYKLIRCAWSPRSTGCNQVRLRSFATWGLTSTLQRATKELAKQLGIQTDQLTEADKIQARNQRHYGGGYRDRRCL